MLVAISKKLAPINVFSHVITHVSATYTQSQSISAVDYHSVQRAFSILPNDVSFSLPSSCLHPSKHHAAKWLVRRRRSHQGNYLYNTIICNTIKPPTMVNGITFWAFNIPPTPMLPTSLLEEAMHVHNQNQSCMHTVDYSFDTLSDYISLAIFLESATKRRPCTDNFTYIRVNTMRAFSSSTSSKPP